MAALRSYRKTIKLRTPEFVKAEFLQSIAATSPPISPGAVASIRRLYARGTTIPMPDIIPFGYRCRVYLFEGCGPATANLALAAGMERTGGPLYSMSG
jgi:hypothetical protein